MTRSASKEHATMLPEPQAEDRTEAGGVPRLVHPFCAWCDDGGVLSTESDDKAVRVKLRPGMRLYERGRKGRVIYVVQDGLVEETVPGADGEPVVVRLVTRGGVTGLPALVGQSHGHSAVVLQEGTACRIPVALVGRMLAAGTINADRNLLDSGCAIRDQDFVLTRFRHGKGRSRLAHALLHLCESAASGHRIRLARQGIARLVGMTPVSVARLMAEFRERGLVEERGRACVGIDRERLASVAEMSDAAWKRMSTAGTPGSAFSRTAPAINARIAKRSITSQ